MYFPRIYLHWTEFIHTEIKFVFRVKSFERVGCPCVQELDVHVSLVFFFCFVFNGNSISDHLFLNTFIFFQTISRFLTSSIFFQYFFLDIGLSSDNTLTLCFFSPNIWTLIFFFQVLLTFRNDFCNFSIFCPILSHQHFFQCLISCQKMKEKK